VAASPHWILSAAAASPWTLRRCIQPVKALGSITSGLPPQVERSRAAHASNSNWGASMKSQPSYISASNKRYEGASTAVESQTIARSHAGSVIAER
jgi:triphosphoribosyl-dephospho-CoA synthetase